MVQKQNLVYELYFYTLVVEYLKLLDLYINSVLIFLILDVHILYELIVPLFVQYQDVQ
jgi:hypothetical protein